MRRHIILLFAAALAMSSATQASAQERPNTRVPIRRGGSTYELAINDFQPRTGAIGTLVTITGKGFTPDIQIYVGGRAVEAREIKDNKISFHVPEKYGNGTVVLRHPGAEQDIMIGNFTVIDVLQITNFAPKTGAPGTKVEIQGNGFRPDDQVLMNGQVIPVIKRDGKRIVVAIPMHATTDYLMIARADGVTERSAQQFTVIQAEPAITAVTPANGPAGTRVRIAGANFASNVQVFYDKLPLPILSRDQNSVEVQVPFDTRVGHYFYVKGPNGDARSPYKFQLEVPVVLSRVTPTSGRVGASVQLLGQYFRQNDQVQLNGVPVPIVRMNSTQITVKIPQGVQSGPFVIVRSNQQLASSEVFEVLQSPDVYSFSPTSGQPGTQVTIAGSNFEPDATVLYGNRPAKIVQHKGSNTLMVQIPAGANENARFTVRTRAGTAASDQEFQLQIFPVVTDVTPRRGYAGTRLTVRGRQIEDVNAVLLGNLPLTIVTRRPGQIVVEIPQGAQSADIAVQSYGQTLNTQIRFEVLSAPAFGSFSPPSGLPGTEIVINGSNFTNNTIVRLGNQVLPIIRRSLPSQLVVQLPQTRGKHYLWVQEGNARIRSASEFQVLEPIFINSVRPVAGRPGTEVVLRGDNFTSSAQVFFGKQQAPIVRWSDREIVVQVPADVKPGERNITVRDGAVEVRAPGKFMVQGAMTINGFSPNRVEAGDFLVVDGQDFSNDVRVFWGQRELPVDNVGNGGNRITVYIPVELYGTDYLYVDDGSSRVKSAQPLEVLALAKGKKPKHIFVRDHRKNKNNKNK